MGRRGPPPAPTVVKLMRGTKRSRVNLAEPRPLRGVPITPPVDLSPYAADLELPKIEPGAVEFYEHDEAGALYEAAGEWRPLIELGMQVGLRPGEMYGLHGHRVDWLRGGSRSWT